MGVTVATPLTIGVVTISYMTCVQSVPIIALGFCIRHKPVLRCTRYLRLFGRFSLYGYSGTIRIQDFKVFWIHCTFNHRPPIEIGRWQNTNRENRVYNLCQGKELGDKFHYLFQCTEFIHDNQVDSPKIQMQSTYCKILCLDVFKFSC